MEFTIDNEFATRVPDYRILVIECDVTNSPVSESQMREFDSLAEEMAARYEVADINRIPAIAATRAAYKACGKDPNRYRPSQEQLMRRIVRGLGLYHIDAVVDAGNQFSVATGCPIGCFDADRIEGASIALGIGRHGEPYDGIGRGELNIEGIPVIRDSTGGFGTPTSDCERTKITSGTVRMLATIHLFDSTIDADEVMDTFTDIFTRHAKATNISHRLYHA